MANERTGERPVEKTAEKPAANRSRHRSGRSGQSARPQGDSSGRSGNSGRQQGDSSQRLGQSARPQGDSSGRKSALRWTWRDYALQLSVVVIGVMVTFVGSDMIGRWSQQRQVKAVMQLVVDELKINRVQLQKVCDKLRYDRKGMLMLQRYEMDLDKIPGDSLDHYVLIIGSWQSLRPQVDALEVLKSSGVIASVGSKQLLLDVLGCYNRVQNFGAEIDTYNGRKMKALDHLFANTRDFTTYETNPKRIWQTYFNDSMCSGFLGSMAFYFGSEDSFDRFLTEVDTAIAAINEEYGLE